MIDRRTAMVSAAAALAAVAASGPAGAGERGSPLVIAHRGASGERPEHTPMAYRVAIAQGADFIEPDLVLTKDGHFVCRHENEIGETTDVGQRPEFAARRATRVIDGQSLTGWFTEDFTLAELKTLGCRERLPQLRPGNVKYDLHDRIPTLEEVIALAAEAGRRTGRIIGLYPEIKHPAYFAGIGLGMEARLAAAMRKAGFDSPSAPVFIQCFEVGPLKTLRTMLKTPLVQLVSDEGGPADLPGVTYDEMASAAGLKAIAAYADGVGPEKSRVLPVVDGAPGAPTAFVANAHAAGLKVHPWTVRRENYFLPERLRRLSNPPTPEDARATGDVGALLKALYTAGVDGVFTDNPAEAVAARTAFLAG